MHDIYIPSKVYVNDDSLKCIALLWSSNQPAGAVNHFVSTFASAKKSSLSFKQYHLFHFLLKLHMNDLPNDAFEGTNELVNRFSIEWW